MSLPLVPNDGFIYDVKAYNGEYHLLNSGVKVVTNAQPGSKPKKYLLPVAGQSNSQGSSLEPMLANEKLTNDKIKQFGRGNKKTYKGDVIGYNPGKEGDIIPAQHPLQHHGIASVNSIGFAIVFCEEFLKDHPNSEIIIVPSALGGTGFLPSAGYIVTWDKTVWAHKNLYNIMIENCNKVLSNDPEIEVLACLWHQGENSVGNWAYPAKLDKLVRDMRADLFNGKGKNMPFICGTMLSTWRAMNSATNFIHGTHIWIKYRFQDGITDCANFDHIKEATPDGLNVHFTANGLRDMGKGYYTKFKELTTTKDFNTRDFNAGEMEEYNSWKELYEEHKDDPPLSHMTRAFDPNPLTPNSSWEDVCKKLMENELHIVKQTSKSVQNIVEHRSLADDVKK